MASTSSATSGTLDVASLVSQLMSIERQPINKLNTKVSAAQTKISSFGTIKGLVSSFQSAMNSLGSKLESFSASSSDSSVLSAAASSTATAGSYAVVVTTLAKAQSLVAAGQASSSSAIAASDSTVTFTVGTTSTDITIAAGASLQDIRTAINAAKIGVTATIVNDGSGTPYRLAISADNSGTSNAVSSITVKSGGDAAVNDLLAYNATENVPTPVTPMSQPIAAVDANFTVNGIQIIKASNTVTDAVEGVTLTLAKEGASANLTVARDKAAISEAATNVVTTYNSLVSKLKTLTVFPKGTTPGGALAGDGTVRLIQDQLTGILSTAATGGSLSRLSEVGIALQSDGSLKLDSSALSSAIDSKFSDVVNLLTSETGFATRINTWASSVVQTGGMIDSRTTSLNTTIDTYNAQIDRLEVRMTILQKQYTTTYSNLNVTLANMTKTTSFLTQQFSGSSA